MCLFPLNIFFAAATEGSLRIIPFVSRAKAGFKWLKVTQGDRVCWEAGLEGINCGSDLQKTRFAFSGTVQQSTGVKVTAICLKLTPKRKSDGFFSASVQNPHHLSHAGTTGKTQASSGVSGRPGGNKGWDTRLWWMSGIKSKGVLTLLLCANHILTSIPTPIHQGQPELQLLSPGRYNSATKLGWT